MKYHLDRALKYTTEVEHKSLYQWAIREAADDNKTSSDQIPWEWTLNFRAIDCLLSDGVSVNRYFRAANEDAPQAIVERQSIRINLICDDGGKWSRRTRFSMFGTNREVKDIWLEIYKADRESDHELCEAWGIPSYTAEIDFLDTLQEDIFGFKVVVKPSTFDRYVATMKAGDLDAIAFSAGQVSGFYSGWSPGVSTTSIKILTVNKEHHVEGAEELELPRLREVGEFSVSLSRKIEFKPPAELSSAAEAEGHPTGGELPITPSQMDLESKKLLKSLQSAAWCAVALLAALAWKAWGH